MDLNITKILHSSLLVKDTKQSLTFYCDVLGLEVDDSRPDLGFPGAWLCVGSQQISRSRSAGTWRARSSYCFAGNGH